MAWEATDETVAVGGGAGPGGWTEDQSSPWLDRAKAVGQTAVDFATAAGNTGTFGLDVRRDALAGWLAGDYPDYSTGVEAERKKLEKQRERSPIASVAGDVAGAMALPSLGGAGLAARLGGGWGARALGHGIEGAAVGAAQGAGNTYTGKPLDYLSNAAFGGGVGGVLGAGMGSVFGPRGGMRSSARPTTLDEATRETNMAYNALRANQAAYNPAHFTGAANRLEQNMLHQGFIPDPGYSTASFRATERMRDLPTNPMMPTPNAVTPYNIDIIRQGINKIPPAASADRAAGRMVKDALDEFIVNPPPGAVLPGSQAAAAQAGRQAEVARQMRAAQGRLEMFDDLMENARTQAAGRDSGLNLQNKLRQAVGGGLRQRAGESAFSRGGFNDPEIAALTRFARVPAGDATLRYVDRLFGGGGGLGAVAAGGVIGGAADKFFRDDPQAGALVGAGIPAAGLALRMVGNRRATQNMNELRDMIGRRNPLYQQRAATAPMVPPPGTGAQRMRNAITAEWLKQQQNPLRITVNPDPRFWTVEE